VFFQEVLSGMLEFSWSWDFILRFLSITLIDLSLSGDNAIVIGMAAASLPKKERKWAIVFGGGLAIVLRVLLTTIASLLMMLSLLSAAGGLVLFWVAWKLIKMDVEGPEEGEEKTKHTKNFRQAIIVILTADFMMSLDNVIAVAGTAHGDIVLLILGLLLSMPLLIGTGGAISLLIDRFKWLVFVGAAVISFAGARMILEDRFIESRIHMPTIFVVIISAMIGIALPALFVWFSRKKAKSSKSDSEVE
jgi:YjbE family integral membrane protein